MRSEHRKRNSASKAPGAGGRNGAERMTSSRCTSSSLLLFICQRLGRGSATERKITGQVMKGKRRDRGRSSEEDGDEKGIAGRVTTWPKSSRESLHNGSVAKVPLDKDQELGASSWASSEAGLLTLCRSRYCKLLVPAADSATGPLLILALPRRGYDGMMWDEPLW